MNYVEFLSVRKTLYWMTGWLVLFAGLTSLAIANSNHGVIRHVTGAVPADALIAGGAMMAAWIGSAFGCALSAANDGHLALAWTKPASRDRLALSMTLVHVVGIAITFLITLAIILGVFALFGSLDAIKAGGDTGGAVVRALIFALAWYGIILAVTASMRGRGGVAALITWIAAAVLLSIDEQHFFGGAAAVVINAIDHLNPLYYYGTHYDDNGRNISSVSNATIVFTALTALAVAGYAAALAQWRRLEA